MALSGKKITELDQISDVTDASVLPIVHIQGSSVDESATKVKVGELKNHILSSAQLKKTVITSSETTPVIENVFANTIYQFTEPLTSLTIEGAVSSYEESVIYFKTSSDGFTSSIGGDTLTLLNENFICEPNKEYIIRISNNLATIDVLSKSPVIYPIIDTSGEIELAAGCVYCMTLDGDTTFVLPTTDHMFYRNLNQILLQLTITQSATIDWGTTRYFNEEPVSDAGMYNIIWEYDYLSGFWFVGQVAKVVPAPEV